MQYKFFCAKGDFELMGNTYSEIANGETEEKHYTYKISEVNNKTLVCYNPWNCIRIRANGDMNVCGCRGYNKEFKMQDFIKNGKINWNDVFNEAYYKKLCKNFLKGCYADCMHNCPGIPKHFR